MNSQQLADLEKQVDIIIANAKESRTTLSNYQNGAESLRQASQSLEKLAAEQQLLVQQLEKSIKSLSDTSTVELLSQISTLVKAMQRSNDQTKQVIAEATNTIARVQSNVDKRLNSIESTIKSSQHDISAIKGSLDKIMQHLNDGVIVRKRHGLFGTKR